MDIELKNKFIRLWKKYFNDSELPITLQYSKMVKGMDIVKSGSLPRCIIGALAEVRKGHSLIFDCNSIGCFGGRKYLGFAETIRPEFNYFLSCGIPGKIEGERYKKSPQLVEEIMKSWPDFKAPEPLAVFHNWANLDIKDNPEVVIFFARPDVLSGLFTLANFDEPGRDAVIAPFGSGCSSIISYPFLENESLHPRAVLGMFDPSARPFMPKDTLSFSVPMKKLITMIDNIEESFLITGTWKALQKRIESPRTNTSI
jgi:hypothetical protein